jgi:hypothetical protein
LKRLAIAVMLLIGSTLVAAPAIAQEDSGFYAVDPATDQGYDTSYSPLWEESTYCDQGICVVFECPTVGLGPCSVLYTYYDPSWWYVDPLGDTY